MRKLLVKGIVQGVGFRPFVFRLAQRYGLAGHVKNLGDAGVEILVVGPEPRIEAFIRALREEGTTRARIDEITELPADGPGPGGIRGFAIIESGGSGATGTLPPDGAMCDACLAELFDGGNARRFHYPFNSCVDCGPRLATLHRLPYDRANTSLDRFPMCEDCRREYADPEDRRLHYQGISCARCGPAYTLHDVQGRPLAFDSTAAMVEEAVRLLEGGGVLAVKGVTGTHIACSVTDDAVLERFRAAFNRPAKPFAVMTGSIDMARRVAHLSAGEERALLSAARPIVLVTPREDGGLSGVIAPGLRNVGLMLPYAGIHHLLFARLRDPLLMTSANFPGQPMLTDNREILERLGGVVDGYLLHDLEIKSRCDDSVMRFAGETPLLIRRSRGFAPSSIRLPFRVTRTVLGLGSELNNTVCLVKDAEAFVSQYVGDTSNLETLAYLDRALRTLLGLARIRLEDLGALACDLNPAFDLRPYAENLASQGGIDLHLVQHHEAHAGSLMGEHGADGMAVIAVDGLGYGSDGKAWGGEIFTALGGRITRAAHLREQRMPGGDAATLRPMRMLAGILFDRFGPRAGEILASRAGEFRYGASETNVVVGQLERDLNVVRTTSCGRVLDALSALLGLCTMRTYDGEPAMKLEAAATEPKHAVPAELCEGALDTTGIVVRALELLESGEDRGGIAASCQAALARGLAAMAVDAARRAGLPTVGLSGGVAYNAMIHRMIREAVLGAGLNFVTNTFVPCGDGGVAFGQAVALAYRMGWIEPL